MFVSSTPKETTALCSTLSTFNSACRRIISIKVFSGGCDGISKYTEVDLNTAERLPRTARAPPPAEAPRGRRSRNATPLLESFPRPLGVVEQTQTETWILELSQGRCRRSGGRRLPRRLHSGEEAFEVLITLEQTAHSCKVKVIPRTVARLPAFRRNRCCGILRHHQLFSPDRSAWSLDVGECLTAVL